MSEILSKDFNNYPNYLPIKYKTQEVLFNHSKPFVHNNGTAKKVDLPKDLQIIKRINYFIMDTKVCGKLS